MDERDVTRQMEQTADEAREQGQRAAAGAREHARDVRSRLSEEARSMAHQAREQATHQAEHLRERGRSMIDAQKGRAADEVSHFGAAIHSAADRLREQEDVTIAGYADSLASQLDQAADYLRNRDLMDLFHDAQSFARRRPEVVLGGMFIAGLALARFIKVSGLTGDYGRGVRSGGYSEPDEYGSYSGYTEGSAYLGGGVEADTDPARNINVRSARTAPLAGGIEHVDAPDFPTTPGSVGPSATSADSDITSSNDITGGTRPGGPASVQP